MHMEEYFGKFLQFDTKKPRLLLIDRGAMDYKAYTSDKLW